MSGINSVHQNVLEVNLINLRLEQSCFSYKLLEPSPKKDKLWIRWVHIYYIKNQPLEILPKPTQASWMLQGIWKQEDISLHVSPSLLQGKRVTRRVDLSLLEYRQRVSWKYFMYNNAARTKVVFTLWLHFHNRLLTGERLLPWGLDIDAG